MNRLPGAIFAAALVAAAVTGRPAAAQTQEQPELPALTPHEVEILGQLEISFPSLQRQPLVGFNPPPRLPEIPADRRPFVEEYKQESGDLPPSPIQRPEPPGIAGLATYQPARVEIDATAGRYFSRAVRGRLGLPVSRTESFLAHIEHRGWDSYEPFDAEAPFSTFDAGVGFATNLARLSAGAEVTGFLDTYTMYGAGRASNTSLEQSSDPEREARGVKSAGWIRTVGRQGPEASARILYEGATFRTTIAVDGGPTLERTSRRYGLDGRVAVPAGDHRFWLDGEVSHSMLNAVDLANDQSTGYEAGAGVTLAAGRAMQVLLGARFLGYRIEDDTEPLRQQLRPSRQSVAPDVRLELYPGHGALIYAQTQPAMIINDLISLHERNPFIIHDPVIAPSLKSIDAEAGGRVYVGPLQLAVRGGYQDVANYLFFEHAEPEDGGLGRGFSSIRYDAATIYHAGGDVSVTLAQGLQATVGATYRRGRLGDEETIIPYFGPVVSKAMLSYSFDRSRGLVQLTGTYESSRYRDRLKTRQIGDYFDADLAVSYYVSPAIKLLFELDNISADYLERFDGYQQPSFVARLGAGLRW